MENDTRRYIRLRKIPQPLAAFAGLYRQGDGLQIFADHYSLIVRYKAQLPRINHVWPTEVILQFIDFQRYEHSNLGRENLPNPTHQPALEMTERDRQLIFVANYQGSRLRVEATDYRVYAIHESEFDIDERELISPASLLAKRAYWEKQLWDIHFPVFDNVTARNKERVWQRIQERYLFRYSRFLRVEADWGGSGVWGISFPGSYGTNPNYDYGSLKLSRSVVRRFEKWMALYSCRDPEDPAPLDRAAYDREGEWLARELKKAVDAETYVEYYPGREIR
jgi:hypothetical protein